MQLCEGVLGSLFPGILITQTKLVNQLVSQAAWGSRSGLYKPLLLWRWMPAQATQQYVPP